MYQKSYATEDILITVYCMFHYFQKNHKERTFLQQGSQRIHKVRRSFSIDMNAVLPAVSSRIINLNCTDIESRFHMRWELLYWMMEYNSNESNCIDIKIQGYLQYDFHVLTSNCNLFDCNEVMHAPMSRSVFDWFQQNIWFQNYSILACKYFSISF